MWFHLQAAGRLIARRKGPVVRMVVIAIVASTWCIAGAMWALGTWRDGEERAAAMTLDVVCADDSTGRVTRELARAIARKRGVVEATALSRDAVWKEFAREMRISDDNLQSVADLPSMIRVRLEPRLVTEPDVERIATEIRQSSQRTVASVTWPTTYVAMVEEHRRTLAVGGGVAGVLSLILFVVGVSYAFKAEVHRAGSDLRVAELLGATTRWIAAPHMLVGLVAGAIGLSLSALVTLSLLPPARHLAPWASRITTHEVLYAVGVVAILGVLVSWGQSVLAVREEMRRR